jgi:hypothetical protein
VNGLVERIELVPDEGVRRLCCVIEATLEDGSTLAQRQDMEPKDYSFTWDEVSALVRRIGGEEGVPPEAYDRIERFARGLPGSGIGDLLAAFALLPGDAR